MRGDRGGVGWYYNAELAFYGGSLGMILFWEERRKDHYVMLAHHIFTVALIVLSKASRSVVALLLCLLWEPLNQTTLIHQESYQFQEVSRMADYADDIVPPPQLLLIQLSS